MKKIEIKQQTARSIRKLLRTDICKDKKKHECAYCKMLYNRMTRQINCDRCFVKVLDNELKEAINKR